MKIQKQKVPNYCIPHFLHQFRNAFNISHFPHQFRNVFNKFEIQNSRLHVVFQVLMFKFTPEKVSDKVIA